MTIATTILDQLGGGRFLAMTGAKYLLDIHDGLTMRLPRNASKANRLTVKLTPMDTYTMTFTKETTSRINMKTGKYIDGTVKVIKEIEDVYCDMLQDIFTMVTGMYTHL